MPDLEDNKGRILNAAILIAIPASLALVHVLAPTSLRQQLVFDHSEPSLLTMWASTHIHWSISHLTSNLLGHATAVLPTYFILTYENREREFRKLLIVFVLVLPFLIQAADYAFFQWMLGAKDAATRGFSGIVGALFGLLFAALLGLVQRESGDWRKSFFVGQAVILLVLGNILFSSGTLTFTVAGVVALGIARTLWALLPNEFVRDAEARRQFANEYFMPGVLGLYAAAVLIILLPALFPVNWIHEDSVTNIFAHFVGLGLGFFIAIVAPHVYGYSQ